MMKFILNRLQAIKTVETQALKIFWQVSDTVILYVIFDDMFQVLLYSWYY